MGLGDSAGRSAGNRTARDARRRNTQRERALIDPPWDPEPEARHWTEDLTPRGRFWWTLVSYAAAVGLTVLTTFLLLAWFYDL